MKDILDKKVFPYISKPSRYLGNELNSIHKDLSKMDLKVVLTFPDTYEIGMSNLGIQILYSILNEKPNIAVERTYMPASDMIEKLKELDLPLFSLESKKPVSEFDLFGFSVQHELTYTNILEMLDLGGIPLNSQDRNEKHLLIFGGGPSTFNPESLADFFDFFVIGEAEEAIVEIADSLIKNKNKSRKDKLISLYNIEGIYVPSLEKKKVKKRMIDGFKNLPCPVKPMVPFLEIVHNRVVLEIMRGCPRGCRFCQARFVTRPLRMRDKKLLIEQADELLKNTGFEEISLVSLSSSDYKDIKSLATELSEKYKDKKISISLPSLRLDSLSMETTKAIRGVRQTSITVAPESGTQRLRDIINKDLSEKDILDGVKMAFENGIQSIKLYFMIGLPGETDEDIKGIVDLSKRILEAGKSFHKNKARVTINVSTFIPKPHTPFQWEKQISIEEAKQKQQYLKDNSRIKGLDLKWHDAESSWLEGIFSRGDRKLGKALEEAWKLGARFDAWSDQFKPEIWRNAFKNANIDPEDYLREIKTEEELPWDFIDTGISRDFLLKERKKALKFIG